MLFILKERRDEFDRYVYKNFTLNQNYFASKVVDIFNQYNMFNLNLIYTAILKDFDIKESSEDESHECFEIDREFEQINPGEIKNNILLFLDSLRERKISKAEFLTGNEYIYILDNKYRESATILAGLIADASVDDEDDNLSSHTKRSKPDYNSERDSSDDDEAEDEFSESMVISSQFVIKEIYTLCTREGFFTADTICQVIEKESKQLNFSFIKNKVNLVVKRLKDLNIIGLSESSQYRKIYVLNEGKIKTYSDMLLVSPYNFKIKEFILLEERERLMAQIKYLTCKNVAGYVEQFYTKEKLDKFRLSEICEYILREILLSEKFKVYDKLDKNKKMIPLKNIFYAARKKILDRLKEINFINQVDSKKNFKINLELMPKAISVTSSSSMFYMEKGKGSSAVSPRKVLSKT